MRARLDGPSSTFERIGRGSCHRRPLRSLVVRCRRGPTCQYSIQEIIRRTLGEHIFAKFIENKQIEWDACRSQVHAYEIDRYLPILLEDSNGPTRSFETSGRVRAAA